MARRRTQQPHEIYEFEITLLEIKPRIWRRFAVWNNDSLMVLHDIIQMVMGWKDCHLHEFSIGDWTYASRDPDFDDLDERETRDERKSYLRDVLGGEGFRFRYRYDMGDNWQHGLEVMKVHTPEKDVRYPVCLAGERACPPEDVGGIWGYANMLEAVADPKHEEHEQYVEWIGGSFDPGAFDLKEVNQMLRGIR